MEDKCPTCRSCITHNNLYYIIDDTSGIINLQDNTPVTNSKKLVGSKITCVINYINNEIPLTDKIVIYTSFDFVAEEVMNTLNSIGIITLLYCGSFYRKKTILQSFNKDPNVRVIVVTKKMLHSSYSLSSANKIIFLEPLLLSPDMIKNTENKVIHKIMRIGRKEPLGIVRFIVNNSIEESIFNDRYINL
jgi:SNF2 family DNA or RNA helicase